MDIFKYKTFLDLHKDHLKQIFFPIQQFFIQKKNLNKDSHLFLPKNDILLNYVNGTIRLSNFGNSFCFPLSYKDIKEIKIYAKDKKYKVFWTCGKDFTQFYFKNYLNKRIGKKSKDSYQSINLDDENDLQGDKYYILPDKEFNFEKVINSIKQLNWKNPPQELNFIINKGKYSRKYEPQKINFENENLKTFFYNAHIGITLSIIDYLIYSCYNKDRILYFDCNLIFKNSINENKKYFSYFLCLLFLEKESKEANEFVMNIYYNFNKYNDNFENLLNDIIQYFSNNKKILIIFDNIYNKDHYYKVEKMRSNINVSENNHIFIRKFIQINRNTLQILREFLYTKNTIKTVGKCENKVLFDDLEIVKEFVENKKECLTNYKNVIDTQLKNKFDEYSINKCLNLIKLFHYLYIDVINEDLFKKIIDSGVLEDFIEFLYIITNEGSIQIKFRNKIIENFFKNYYILYYNIFSKEQSKTFVKEILESEQGYNFERQIIFSVILGNLKNSYNRVNIERIYCVDKFPKIDKNKNLLFYQTNSNAPLYDFSVLLEDKNESQILKVFQIFINKKIDEIKKLDFDKINFDISYFIEKINRILNIKIKGFTLGIIFSKKRYDEHKEDKSVKNIKNFCLKNKYEFILYDIDKNQFFIDESIIENKYNLKEFKSFEEIKSGFLKPIKIFKDNCIIHKKFYIEKIRKSSYNQLKNIFAFFDGKIKPKLVGKFKCDISVLEQNENKNIIYFYIWNNDKNNINIYFNNYELYKSHQEIINSKEKNKKEILIFMNENSENLVIKKDLNFKKIKFIVNKDDQELNRDYLILNKEDDMLDSLDSSSEDEKEEENSEEIIDETMIMSDKIEKQNLESPPMEYEIEFRKDNNEFNYAFFKQKVGNDKEINNSIDRKDEKNSDSSNIETENNINISGEYNSKESESEELSDEINLESKDFKLYRISIKLFNELNNGEKETYDKLKEKIYHGDNFTEENNLLKRKREIKK